MLIARRPLKGARFAAQNRSHVKRLAGTGDLVVQAGLGDQAGRDVCRLGVQRVPPRPPTPVRAAHTERARLEVEAKIGAALGAVVDEARARSLDASRLPRRRDEVDLDGDAERTPVAAAS